MEFKQITEKAFSIFAKKHENKCYLQSTYVGDLRKRRGWDAYYLGVYKNRKIVAATLLLSKKRYFKKEFYAIRGPLVDFRDKEVLSFFIDNLKKFVKSHGGYMLKIDPYIEAFSLDKYGNNTNIFDNTDIIKLLKSYGFIETKAEKMLDTSQAKFMYVIDLNDDLDSLITDMDSKTRQMIHKNEKNGIVIRKGTKKDIPLFVDIMNNTAERRGFVDRGEQFYIDMYETFDKDMVSLVFAELNIDLAYQNLENQKQDIAKVRKEREINRQKGTLNEKKAAIKEKEEDIELTKIHNKELELKDLEIKYGKSITLGGILYVIYENEVASLYGGCYKEFKQYQPFYTIHYEMIKYSVNNGYKRYNFYAILNKLDKNDEQYGIY